MRATGPSYSQSSGKQECRDHCYQQLLKVVDPRIRDFSVLTMPSITGIEDPNSFEWGVHQLHDQGYNPRIVGVENKCSGEMWEKLRHLDLIKSLRVVRGQVTDFLKSDLYWYPPFVLAWFDYCSAFDAAKLEDMKLFFNYQRSRKAKTFVFAATFNIGSYRGAKEDAMLNPKAIGRTLLYVANTYKFAPQGNSLRAFPYRNEGAKVEMLYLCGIFQDKE